MSPPAVSRDVRAGGGRSWPDTECLVGTDGGYSGARAGRRHQAVVPAPLPLPVVVLARAALRRLASRLRLRAAVFLWIVPLPATRSSFWLALRSSVSATSSLPVARAVVNPFTESLICSLRARL